MSRKTEWSVKTQTFATSVWQEDDWFVVQCLEVDVASQGGSEDEALVNLGEALELHFEPPQPNLKPVHYKFEVQSQCR